MSRTLPTSDATRRALRQPGHPASPLLPGRFLVPVMHTVDDMMEDNFAGAVGASLRAEVPHLSSVGDDGVTYWRLPQSHLERQMSGLMAKLRRSIMQHIAAACEACHVPAFDLTNMSYCGVLHHHGCETPWHSYADDTSVRLVFDYFLHSTPVMFQDGLTEFHDGTTVEPRHNRLLLTHPLQSRKVQTVNCYSADALHGRWSLHGTIHGPEPDGYAELADRLRS